jgi:hypothetical protein
MAWRFRKSFKVLPGVRLNISKTGISTSIGAAPFTLNIGRRGVYHTASLPGSGLSFRQRIDAPAPKMAPALAPPSASFQPALAPITPTPIPAGIDVGEEIRSAGTDMMTSAGLAEFRRLLMQAHEECTTLAAEIARVTPRASAARARQRRWDQGFLLKRLLTAKFARITEEAHTAEAELSELQEQLELARLATEIAIEPDIAAAYSRVCDVFAAMSQSKRIWDTLTRKSTDRVAERSAASESITRAAVTFRRGQSETLSCEWAVPILENRSGGDVYLYPAFALYHVTRDTFAVIDVQDISIEYVPTRFIESEEVPADSPIVGHTWLKVNKDGTPDKRFKDNVQIPIVQYGSLKLRSETGLNEEYMLSSAPPCEEFVKAWNAFKKCLAPAGVP